MDLKLKDAIERATKQRAEAVERSNELYRKDMEERRQKEEEERRKEIKLATEWTEKNIYDMIEKSILSGSYSIMISEHGRPEDLSREVCFKVLTSVLNNIDGLQASFEPAEKMTDYPSFDTIYITWTC